MQLGEGAGLEQAVASDVDGLALAIPIEHRLLAT